MKNYQKKTTKQVSNRQTQEMPHHHQVRRPRHDREGGPLILNTISQELKYNVAILRAAQLLPIHEYGRN